jgi:hypothetical protein
MRDVRLPDGSWVTTPIHVGVGGLPKPCEDECPWEDVGPPSEAVPRVQRQHCPKCGQVRGRYLDNPHPEIGDEEEAG